MGAVLALALLVPVGLIALPHWRDLGEHTSIAQQERQGVEYLLALSQLNITLIDAQAAAVSGAPVPLDALARAVDAVSEVDDRLGDDLRVRDRWSQLRDAVEQVGGAQHADAGAAFAAFGEAADLLLDLAGKLRETSGLIRDEAADAYYLQDGVGEELPEALVAAGRLVDLATIATADPGEQAVSQTELSVAWVAVSGPADDLATNIQAALDGTDSRTLSSNVLSKLERFLRDKDALLADVPADGDVSDVDAAQLAQARTAMQASGNELGTAVLLEIDVLLAGRTDEGRGQQWTAILAVAAVVLLVVGSVWLNLAGAGGRGRKVREGNGGPVVGYEPRAAEPPPAGQPEYAGWERAGAR